jgi:Rrf2 family protein
MKFSTRTTYGLRAMINLAKYSKKGNVSLAEIAKQEGISLKYLEKLFSDLKKAKLVKSEMGASGGYKLAKNASRITVYDIIGALEGDITPFHCLSANGKINCSSSCNCGATIVLVKVQEAMKKTLKKIKLSELS